MTEPDTDADEDQTDDQFDTTIDARDVDADDSQGPPSDCPGFGRGVTLMSNGFCGFCQDREGAPDDQDPDVRADGGTVPAPQQDAQAVDDWERAAKAAATNSAADDGDLYRCGSWLATKRDDVVIGTSDDGERAAMPLSDARTLGVSVQVPGRTTVSAGDVQVEAWEVPPVRADGLGATKAPDADDLPDPRPVDARRAVVDAARMDGVTCQRGAYQARRTWMESDGGHIVQEGGPVVVLSMRVGYGGDVVAIFPVIRFHHLRDDWERPTPDWHERGDDVLPADRFDAADLFVDGASALSLPGLAADPDDGGDR